MRLIRGAQYRQVAWDNGGGTTADIVVVRDGGVLLWRLSVADIDRDGPFSNFTGIDRTIVLVEGAGFRLDTGSTDAVLDRPYALYRFAGADAPQCRLIAGPARAFNVMSAAATHTHRVDVDTLAVPAEIEPRCAAYVSVCRGRVRIVARRAGASLVAGAGDTVELCEAARIEAAEPDTVAIRCEIAFRGAER